MQMSLSSVFRLFSVFMVVFLMIVSGELSAQNRDKDKDKDKNDTQAARELCELIKEEAKRESCLNDLRRKVTGGGDDCKDAVKAFNQSNKEFKDACNKAGISGDCFKVIKKCEHCLGGGEGDGEGDCGSPELSMNDSSVEIPDLLSRQDNFSVGVSGWGDAMKGINVDKLRVKYGMCPPLAGSDYKSLEKEVKEGQKNLDDERKKIIKIQEEMNKLQSDHAEEFNKNQEKLKEAGREWEQKRDEIDKKFFAENEAIMKELQQQRDLNEKRKNEITNMNLKKNDEKIKRDQALSALRLKCNEIALTQVQRLQANDFEKMKSNSYSAGDFGALMSRSGLSTREQYQTIANNNYNACLKSNIFTEGKENIEKSYRQALEIINTAITQLNKEIETTTADMQRTLKEKLNQKKREYDRDSQRADKAYTDMQQTMERNQATADRKLQVALQAKSQELTLAQQNVQREEAYLKQKQQLLALKRQYTDGDTDSKSGAVGTAMTSFSEAKGAANSVAEACCMGGNSHKACSIISIFKENAGKGAKAAEVEAEPVKTPSGSR